MKKLVLISILFLTACAQVKTRKQVEKQGESPAVVMVPVKNGESNSTDVEGRLAQSPKVALVLAPSGYRSFSYAQVIKELSLAKIQIDKVVGFEWGSLAGAFFAADSKSHEAEWRLYKLDNQKLETKSFFNLKKSAARPSSDVRAYLQENFGGRDLSSFRVPFLCPQLYLKSGVVSWPTKGRAADIIENCLNYPPHWQPSRGAVAAAFSVSEAIDRLKREGFNVIILVHALPDGELLTHIPASERLSHEILWEEVRRQVWQAKSKATDVIEIKVKGGLFDLDGRKTISQAAEKIAKEQAAQIANKYGF